jgi:hypothetical protein
MPPCHIWQMRLSVCAPIRPANEAPHGNPGRGHQNVGSYAAIRPMSVVTTSTAAMADRTTNGFALAHQRAAQVAISLGER